MNIIPDYVPCPNRKCDGLAALVDARGKLLPITYHFGNTKEPYMLRHCNKCGSWYLVIIEQRR